LLYHLPTVTAFRFRLSARCAALAMLASCGRPAAAPAPSSSSTSPAQSAAPGSTGARGALTPLASEALIVLPVQTLRVSVPEWADKIGDQRAYMSTVDDEIAFAVRDRGLRGQWAFPADLARSARRNPGYAVDPYTIALDPLAPVERDPEKHVGEPLAGQLRAFAGLFNARYALIPVELRLVPDASGGRATLHLVVIDTRAARLTWKADVSGDGMKNFTPAVAAGLAGRVADLFTPAR
jgi:hypothetical protein